MKAAKLIVLAFLLTVAVSVEAAEKVKLTGSELVERLAGYEVLAGVSNETGVNFMVVAFKNGTREVYWNDGFQSGTDTGPTVLLMIKPA